ncbi:Transcriptional regulator WhiB2 [Corynebacterium urogenitale]|uniref:Transcriptional regulator WhiB n=1 Tax=Corynebacterium urogenitale TaxID=2487892 RepID=A0A5J6Z9Q2_9CORY|nr:Transcriptional regulator WhiB2 [Corynebacterium urogenitale]
MDKSVDTAFGGPFADGSAAVDREAPVDSGARQRNLFDLTEDFDLLFDAVEQDWQEQALCAQTDPEAFFPEKGGSTREAKRICQACGVRDECLEYALANDERFGIWGGLSERERRKLKKRIS